MSDYILSVEGCNKSTNSCAQLDLKIPRNELLKLQSMESSKSETVNYSVYTEFWAVSFSITLSFWVLAKIAGVVLGFLKR
ncbi:TPA: hypothetical protein ACPDS2_001334 [Pasteurella multocida]|nr:hypothetical protein [Pasteurella multocida]